MAAVANNPAFAKRVGISQSVGREFITADKGKKFEKGGVMKKKMAGGGGVAASKMGKVVAGGHKAHGEHTVQKKGHTKGKHIVMSKGGMAKGKKAC